MLVPDYGSLEERFYLVRVRDEEDDVRLYWMEPSVATTLPNVDVVATPAE